MHMDTPPGASHADDHGFFAVMSPAAARRQLRLSLAVAAAFAVAALFALSTGQFKPIYTERAAVTLTIEMPASYFTRQANAGATVRKGS